MTTIQERLQALEQSISRLAEDQGRSYDEVLAHLEKTALVERFRNFQARNRAEFEAKGFKPSDVEEWVREYRDEKAG
jgi:hypothetical protein